MDEKRNWSWLLLAFIYSAVWGIVTSTVRLFVESEPYRSAITVGCVVIAFGPVPFAYWLDLKNGIFREAHGRKPPPVWIVVALTAVMIILLALCITV